MEALLLDDKYSRRRVKNNSASGITSGDNTGGTGTGTGRVGDGSGDVHTNNAVLGPCALVVPFVACGDLSGFDADKSYPLQLERQADGKGGKGVKTSGDEGTEEKYTYSYR
jgi:hypothetical protein